MVYRVVISPEAQRDLRGIQRYISFDAPQAALRFTQHLFSKQKVLEAHPEIGRVVPEIANCTLREIIIGNYRVIYKVDHSGKEIIILRYWHAARGVPEFRY
ncbi:MAG: hypothetical protein A3F67_03400 [Verrucomicrobia bacterium RIFCSPHIGHO2_12_FULL_41_10]|nr:MAG: hypothetical protein A3F67_03400 [Verrucomicrobia bacterium RIFCSPHIGHO2_12_FULL_41_10]HLB34854.1 type II toxin-antitoxin system RelE/ParE family toxin [Chthoniobacterales bacterium]